VNRQNNQPDGANTEGKEMNIIDITKEEIISRTLTR
jgi:hypothetical protein